MTKRIAIHSVPRSGSSWLGQIFNSSPNVNFNFQPLFSYAFKDALTLSSNKNDIIHFFNQIALSDDDFLNSMEHIKTGRYPKFKKANNYSHIVYKEVRYHNLLKHLMKIDDEIIVVGLVRNPKAVINSWFQAPKEFKKELNWKKEEEWFEASKKNSGKPEEFNGFKKWLECFEIFNFLKKTYPDRFIEIEYDELLSDTEMITEKIFNFCKIPLNSQTEHFISNSRNKDNEDAYSVYKMKQTDDKWLAELSPDIIYSIDKTLKKENIIKYL